MSPSHRENLTRRLQTETYQVAPGKDDVHGYDGPLKVSYGGKFTNIGQDFLAVAKSFDPAREHTDDPNQIYKSNAYGVRRARAPPHQ